MMLVFACIMLGMSLSVNDVAGRGLDAAYWQSKFTFFDLGPGEVLYTVSVPFGNEHVPTIELGPQIEPSPLAVSNNYALMTENYTSHIFHTHQTAQIYTLLQGRPVIFYLIDPVSGNLTKSTLSPRRDGLVFSIPPGFISAFGWTKRKIPGSFTLMVVGTFPYYRYEDESYPSRSELVRRFPQHRALIERFTIDE